MKRAIILMLDSLGIGASADADKFGDTGANTLGHIAAECAGGRADINRSGPLQLPNLARLGLISAAVDSNQGKALAGMPIPNAPIGSYGYAEELSSGKDTPSGHWEMAGVPVLFDWGYFLDQTNAFPLELLDAIISQAGLPGVLGNCHASGTEIIDRLGDEHIATGKPIVYTSADSVFQIACHEEHYGLERLYELCRITRTLLDPYNIARVIARPFVGSSATGFSRTGNRMDISMPPPDKTLLDRLTEDGGNVISVGKIADIYAHQGITRKVKATGLAELFDSTLAEMNTARDRSLVFTNFVDFDSSYGHRRDVAGYAAALEYFDSRLPELLDQMQLDDVLVLTADHGCDPTFPGSDHTREHVPVVIYSKNHEPRRLGKRSTFADIGQTLATHFSLDPLPHGQALLG